MNGAGNDRGLGAVPRVYLSLNGPKTIGISATAAEWRLVKTQCGGVRRQSGWLVVRSQFPYDSEDVCMRRNFVQFTAKVYCIAHALLWKVHT